MTFNHFFIVLVQPYICFNALYWQQYILCAAVKLDAQPSIVFTLHTKCISSVIAFASSSQLQGLIAASPALYAA
jgi:hypothetical protein